MHGVTMEFYAIFYSYATHVVLLNFTVYITVYVICFYSFFVKIFWIPNMCTATEHTYTIMVHYWPDEDCI